VADFSAWQVASFRSGIAALVLAVALPAARRGISWRAALVGLAYGVTLVSFVLANRLTTSANAIYLQSTAPIYLLLLAPWLLREQLRRRDVPLVVAVLGGLLLVMFGTDTPSGTAPNPGAGNLIAMVSGLSYALMICGLRWLGRNSETEGEGLAAVLLGNLFACLIALPMALPLAAGAGVVDWATLIYLGAFQIGLAYLLITKGLRRVTALEASLLLLIETACNPVWTWLLLREVPSIGSLAGGALIIGATAWHAFRNPVVAVMEPA
jgi:drug/metabolite transporter (DMT)-like permease